MNKGILDGGVTGQGCRKVFFFVRPAEKSLTESNNETGKSV